jgi:hypothetical protein
MRSVTSFLCAAGAALIVSGIAAVPAIGQPAARANTMLDLKKCYHARGRDNEDYGLWRCAGYAGTDILLSAGDQRMQVSFGHNAAHEPAASQTFPAFNSVDEGVIEWRLDPQPRRRPRPFATIMRWNVRQDEAQGFSDGPVLVVTRLGEGKVCHVGYVDARANPDASELARKIADENARAFQCGKDRPIVLGKTSARLGLPGGA